MISYTDLEIEKAKSFVSKLANEVHIKSGLIYCSDSEDMVVMSNMCFSVFIKQSHINVFDFIYIHVIKGGFGDAPSNFTFCLFNN